MKSFLFTLLCIIFLVSSHLSLAQVNKDYKGPQPEVKMGSKSLVFLYTPFQSNLGSVPAGSAKIIDLNAENLDYSEVNLGGVGFRYFMTNNISLMGSLGYGTQTDKTEQSSGSSTNTTEVTATVIGISADIDNHLNSLYSVSPYIGLNINFGSASSTLTDESNSPSGATKSTVEYSSTAFGIGVNIGFDWYFTEGMSLGGKYTIGYKSYSEPEIKVIDQGITDTVNGPSSSSFGTSIASIILNVHF